MAVIWAAGQPERLSPIARTALMDTENEVLISTASVWEIAIKHKKGQLPMAARLAQDFEGAMVGWEYDVLPISIRHAQLAPALRGKHKDPFDRMISAQAILESAALISSDTDLDEFGVQRLW